MLRPASTSGFADVLIVGNFKSNGKSKSKSNGKSEMRRALPCADHDETVICFGRDDASCCGPGVTATAKARRRQPQIPPLRCEMTRSREQAMAMAMAIARAIARAKAKAKTTAKTKQRQPTLHDEAAKDGPAGLLRSICRGLFGGFLGGLGRLEEAVACAGADVIFLQVFAHEFDGDGAPAVVGVG
jgi:hypothetical protein